jgi:hypothetical protein
MRKWTMGWAVALVLGTTALTGCGGVGLAVPSQSEGATEPYGSQVLDTSYAGALSVGEQLALGTLVLEGTENAVTPEQAATLLLPWQALQSNDITAVEERNALLQQIEHAMTQAQLEAIATMRLTGDDLTAWMEERGMAPPDLGPGEGAPAADREAIRATIEAGGSPPEELRGLGAQMSDEEREAIRATVEAGGGLPFGGAGERPGAGRAANVLIQPLVELLTGRAAE